MNLKNGSGEQEFRAKSLVMYSYNEADAIEFQKFNDSNIYGSANMSTEIYNLAGQRVQADYKGIIISGGKKYLNR